MTDRQVKGAPKETPSGLLTGLTEKLSELEEAVGRQADRFTAVLEIGTAISSARDVDGLLRLVMDRLTSLLGAEASTLFMLDSGKQELWSRVLRGSALKEIRLPLASGIAGHVVSNGQTLLLGDAYADIRFNPDIDRLSGFRTRSIIAAPLRHVSGRILGVLEVLHRKVNAFNADDRSLVDAVASQIAAVLDNVLLLDELRSQNEKLLRAGEKLSQAVQDLDVLYEIERAVTSSEGENELLGRILAKAIDVIGAGSGSIVLSERGGGSLLYFRAPGEKSERLTALGIRAGQGIAGRVAETGEAIRVNRADESPHHDKGLARKLGFSAEAVLCVPIEGEDEVLGALELINKDGGFGETDHRLATLLAGQSARAIALRNRREEGEREARLASIGQALSSVVHDLRTPMMVISGYAQLMAAEEEASERRRAADVIEKQFEQMNAMIGETLAFARGERDVLIRKVYLTKFMAEIEEYLRKDLEPSGVELKVNCAYTGVARFDENKIKRVIYNIARNAAEAMPDGGRFTVTVDREDAELVFRFADNGPGIPPEIAARLFESFVTARKKNGTGLGLAIVKNIAEEHGGTARFKSRPGKGTTFEVRFPAGIPAD